MSYRIKSGCRLEMYDELTGLRWQGEALGPEEITRLNNRLAAGEGRIVGGLRGWGRYDGTLFMPGESPKHVEKAKEGGATALTFRVPVWLVVEAPDRLSAWDWVRDLQENHEWEIGGELLEVLMGSEDEIEALPEGDG